MSGLPEGRLNGPEALEDAVSLLKRLAHPARLAIVCRLVEGETSVAELESELGLRQPSLSQQLAELRNAGLIAPRREAKTVYYQLADPHAAALIDTLHRLFCPTHEREAETLPRFGTVKLGGARNGGLLGAAVFARVGSGLSPTTEEER